MEVNGHKIFSVGEDLMNEEAKVKFLMKKGMTESEAVQLPIHLFVKQLVWTITMNLCEKPKGHISKKLPI